MLITEYTWSQVDKDGGEAPQWDEAQVFNVDGATMESEAQFKIFDEDLGLDDVVGKVTVKLGQVHLIQPLVELNVHSYTHRRAHAESRAIHV